MDGFRGDIHGQVVEILNSAPFIFQKIPEVAFSFQQ
jgi:hypothetical protein